MHDGVDADDAVLVVGVVVIEPGPGVLELMEEEAHNQLCNKFYIKNVNELTKILIYDKREALPSVLKLQQESG